VCVFIGGAVGTQHLADEDLGTGQSRQRSALAQFDIRGDADLAKKRADPILDAVAQLDRTHRSCG
jgi:hypothetical protein